MATRAQKHARAMANREAFLETERLRGLEAQREDREEREKAKRKSWKDKHEKSHDWKNLDDDCPFCEEMTNGNTKLIQFSNK